MDLMECKFTVSSVHMMSFHAQFSLRGAVTQLASKPTANVQLSAAVLKRNSSSPTRELPLDCEGWVKMGLQGEALKPLTDKSVPGVTCMPPCEDVRSAAPSSPAFNPTAA